MQVKWAWFRVCNARLRTEHGCYARSVVHEIASGDNRVARVNLQSNRVEARIPTSIGNSEGGIAADNGGIWLSTDSAGTLARIDGARNEIDGQVRLASRSFVPVAGAGALCGDLGS
jgi:hypothetical protein